LEIKIWEKIKIWEFKKVTIGSWSYLVGNQPQKIVALHSTISRKIKHSNIKVYLFLGASYCELLYSKINEN
jgi:hypothetical protein